MKKRFSFILIIVCHFTGWTQDFSNVEIDSVYASERVESEIYEFSQAFDQYMVFFVKSA